MLSDGTKEQKDVNDINANHTCVRDYRECRLEMPRGRPPQTCGEKPGWPREDRWRLNNQPLLHNLPACLGWMWREKQEETMANPYSFQTLGMKKYEWRLHEAPKVLDMANR